MQGGSELSRPVGGVSISVSAGEIKTITLKVDGMTCTLCVPAVKKAIQRTDGVKKAEASYEKGEAVVEYDSDKTNPEEFIKVLEKIGYKAALREIR